MLNFFRKYQKVFFLVIATVIICSFVFFGTFSALQNSPTRVDRVVGKDIRGRELLLSEIGALSRFLSADQEDLLTGSRNTPPNLLNDGVLRKDILASGIGEVLVGRHYDAFKSDLEQRLLRIKTYRSYEHPEMPLLSAKAVWQRLNPQINHYTALLQSTSDLDQAHFAHLAKLYQLQSQLPAEWLRRVLRMQEQKYNWVHPDPRLQQGDLALFGFHSLADWFGKNFVDLSAEFIHNAALVAEEKGYRVSFEEARTDLRQVFASAVTRIQEAKVPLEMTLADQLRMLGMDEEEATRIWKKVLLFRKYFADLGHSVFLDRMAYEEFSSVANEKAIVDLYQWPSTLVFQKAYPLYAFQTYLKSVASLPKGDELNLPKTFLSVGEIAKKTPALVATDYRAKVFAVDKREVALRASLKEVWAFETDNDTWARLKKEFPQAFGAVATLLDKTVEERLAVLERLAPNERTKIDAFARLLLVDQHGDWVKEALDAAQGEEKMLHLSAGRIELPYLDEPERLGRLFAQIPESPEKALAELAQFQSKNAFFRFENIEKRSDARVKTFEEAMNDRSLLQLTDQALLTAFPTVRGSLPGDKATQEFADVKEEIAELLLQDLQKQVQKATHEMEGPWMGRRMGFLSAKASSDLQKDPNDSNWVGSDGMDPFLLQFKLHKTQQQLSRTAKEDWMSKQVFALSPDQWSTIHVAEDGHVEFAYLKERQLRPGATNQQLLAGRQVLSADVQKVLAENILSVMQKKHAVILPLQLE